jgi:hypothetical protein
MMIVKNPIVQSHVPDDFGGKNGPVVDSDQSNWDGISSTVTSASFEVETHRSTDQFAQIASGVPRPIAIFLDQISVDPDGQLRLPLGFRR